VRAGIRKSRRIPLLAAAIAAVTLFVGTHGFAQSEKKSPGLFKSQQARRDAPVRIASLSLEVRDKAKLATFSGNVHIVQDDLEVRRNTLLVFYEDASGAKKAGGAGDRQQMRRIEARGAVVITQRDQRATADQADFDVPGNTFTLNGNVVVTKCGDVMRGERLFVDMTTGVSRMEGRVEGVLSPKSRGDC
jgi:lipopolysaccharide export system protein LptA